MEPLPDCLIEMLVRHPASLPEDVRPVVEEYVEKDPFGRAVAQFYRAYYEELDLLDSKCMRGDRNVFSDQGPIEVKDESEI